MNDIIRAKPAIRMTGNVKVSTDLSGGVRVEIGSAGFIFSPDDAIKLGTAILQCAGVNVAFGPPNGRLA